MCEHPHHLGKPMHLRSNVHFYALMYLNQLKSVN
jgi:hypothetical protein